MTAGSSDSLRASVDAAAADICRGFNRAALEHLGAELLRTASVRGLLQYARAVRGEERLHALYTHPQGPSLYLVSDGAGTDSPPHEHGTWALIVGLSGIERNTFFNPVAGAVRLAQRTSVRDIGAGDSVVLEPAVIHATRVMGSHPTFHLHLYGRPLHSLPPFEERVFAVQSEE